MSREDEVQLIKRSITFGSESPEEIIDRLGPQRTFALMSSALRLAVKYKFPTGTPIETIRQYAQHVQSRFKSAEGEVSTTAVEAVIRQAQGDFELAEELKPKDILTMTFLVTYSIMSRARLAKDDLNSFIEQSIAQAGDA